MSKLCKSTGFCQFERLGSAQLRKINYKSLKSFQTLCEMIKKLESSQLSAKCQQISVASLTSVLTVSALWYVHNF